MADGKIRFATKKIHTIKKFLTVSNNREQRTTATLCDYKDFLPYQSYGKFHHPRLAARKAILESLKDSNQDVLDAVRALHANQPLKVKLVRYAKNV